LSEWPDVAPDREHGDVFIASDSRVERIGHSLPHSRHYRVSTT
jgi:hypothetical protein